MSRKKIVIAFAGGGTGGHIYPGIAIADELKKNSNESTKIEIHWIGNSKGMDSVIIEKNRHSGRCILKKRLQIVYR